MKYIMEHYGSAILVSVALVALGIVVVALCTSDGFVAKQFQEAMSSFFDNMKGLTGAGGGA